MQIHKARALLAIVLLVVAHGAAATSKEEQRVADATEVLDRFLRIPEQSIPPSLLSRAYAVAVIPNVLKVGFGISGRRGKGILVVRQDDNSWSNPAFVALTGGSLGWQAGAQSTDVILVFKTREAVDGIANGKFTLGADAAVAAGPVGRHVEGATDIRFQSEVLSYSRNRGLFAGVALGGSGVTMDRKANVAFYSSPSMTPEKIFASPAGVAPEVANDFVRILTAQTSRLPAQQDAVTPAPEPPATPEAADDTAPASGVKTYGMPDPDDE